MGVHSNGEYGVPEGLMFSFPVTVDSARNITVVSDLKISDYVCGRLAENVKELQAELADAELLIRSECLMNKHCSKIRGKHF
jgi:malate/lactate dehydrogenase